MEAPAARRKEQTSSTAEEKLKLLYEISFRFINEALNLELKEKSKEAILCYEKGLRSLKVGLGICETGSESAAQLESINKMKEKLRRAKVDAQIRLEILHAAESKTPSAPHLEEIRTHGVIEANENKSVSESWNDAKALISIDEGVNMFYVDHEREVSTWSTPCHLKIYQLLEDREDPDAPPAFLQCGDWIYPLHPGKSPALKTFYRTYMFPDLSLSAENANLASIGIVLADVIPEKDLLRFERILSCYSDFRKCSAEDVKKIKPPRPPPPYHKADVTEPSAPCAEYERRLVPVSPGDVIEPMEVEEDEKHWSEVVSNGIIVGAKWISWGLGKGAQVTSQLVEHGAKKIREKMQPNAEEAKVDPQLSENIQQIKEVTGAAVKVSGYIVSTLCILTAQLGKQLSPVIRQHGSKLLPEKYRNGDEKSQKRTDDLVKVAVAGLHGFGTVFTSLEEAGRVLYKSVTKATVETVNHKYGEAAGDVTGDAMDAAGNTAKAYWNIKKLGAKAIAKKTAKDTGKAILEDEATTRQSQQHQDGY